MEAVFALQGVHALLCKNTPAGFMYKVTRCDGPLFLQCKTDGNARLQKSTTRRLLDTFGRSKVSREDFL
jgi:hypothetical protein